MSRQSEIGDQLFTGNDRPPVARGAPDAAVVDFLAGPHGVAAGCDIVCNPPFSLADQFVHKALGISQSKVAMLLPASWVQGDKRSRWLETTPLRRAYFIAPRPSMPPGPAVAAGHRPGNGTTDYAWFVWERSYTGTPNIRWLRREPT